MRETGEGGEYLYDIRMEGEEVPLNQTSKNFEDVIEVSPQEMASCYFQMQ